MSEIDLHVYPRFPLTLRRKNSRYKGEIHIDNATYSSIASTPEDSISGAMRMAEWMGGYEFTDVPAFKDPKNPILVDLMVLTKIPKNLVGMIRDGLTRKP